MAAIDFPTTLTAPTEGDFKENYLETRVMDQGQVGSPRSRNRFTRGLERFSFSMNLTDAQKAILDTFYITTLSRGVEIFNWTHPTTAVVYEVKFSVRPKPTHISFDHWNVSVEIGEV